MAYCEAVPIETTTFSCVDPNAAVPVTGDSTTKECKKKDACLAVKLGYCFNVKQKGCFKDGYNTCFNDKQIRALNTKRL
jgi:hypothetical protein